MEVMGDYATVFSQERGINSNTISNVGNNGYYNNNSIGSSTGSSRSSSSKNGGTSINNNSLNNNSINNNSLNNNNNNNNNNNGFSISSASVYKGSTASLHYRVKAAVRPEVYNIVSDVFNDSFPDWNELPSGLGLGKYLHTIL